MLFLKKKINLNLNLFLLIFILLFSDNLHSSIFDFNNKIPFDDLNNSNYKSKSFLNFYKLNLDDIKPLLNNFDLPSSKNDFNSFKCNIDYNDLVITLNINELNDNSFLKLNNEKISINKQLNNSISEQTKLVFYLFKEYPDINETKLYVDENSVTIFYKNKNDFKNFELEYSNNFTIEVVSFFYLKHNELNLKSNECQNIINIFDDNEDFINKLYLSGDNVSFFKQINENINYYSFYNFYNKQYKVFFCNNLNKFKLKYIFTRLNSIDCFKDISSINLFISTKIFDILEYSEGTYVKLDNNIKLNKSFFVFIIYSIILFSLIFLIVKYLYYIIQTFNFISLLSIKFKFYLTFVIIYILYLIRVPILLDLLLFSIILVILYKEINNFLKK